MANIKVDVPIGNEVIDKAVKKELNRLKRRIKQLEDENTTLALNLRTVVQKAEQNERISFAARRFFAVLHEEAYHESYK